MKTTEWRVYPQHLEGQRISPRQYAPDRFIRRQSLTHQPVWPVFLGYGLALLLSAGVFALIGYMLGFVGS